MAIGLSELVLQLRTSVPAESPWLVLAILVLVTVGRMVHNVFIHPLRHFPGPLHQRASSLPWALQHARGTQAFHTQRHHARYGPVVRIGPNHVSFADARVWRDVYAAGDALPKTRLFARTVEAIPTSIVNADTAEHARFRRALAPGFSDAAVRAQGEMLVGTADLLISKLRCDCVGAGGDERAVDLEAYFSWTTFDVAGRVFFREDFGCLTSTENHAWVRTVLASVRSGARLGALRYVGLGVLARWLFAMFGSMALKRVQAYTNTMLRTRLEKDDGRREDLFEGIVRMRNEKAQAMSLEKLSASAFILTLAGTETTATVLSGVTYLLLTHPDVLDRLVQEVRSAFSNEAEIDLVSVNKLKYMLAVLNETLRVYPPLVSGLVRDVPARGATIAGIHVPGRAMVEVQPWSINHSDDNWADPWSFRPERFLLDLKTALARGDRLESLQPFSLGPRNCLGRNLAQAEMRLVLARLLYTFDMRLADDSKGWIERQKAYAFWHRAPLHVFLTERARGGDGTGKRRAKRAP